MGWDGMLYLHGLLSILFWLAWHAVYGIDLGDNLTQHLPVPWVDINENSYHQLAKYLPGSGCFATTHPYEKPWFEKQKLTKAQKDGMTWYRMQSYQVADSGCEPKSLWLHSLSTFHDVTLGLW